MSSDAPNDPSVHDTAPVETAVLLPQKQPQSVSMAPVLPVSGLGRSPPRTTSWSVHNGLLDVESQSVAGSSDISLKLDSNDQVGVRTVLGSFVDHRYLVTWPSPAAPTRSQVAADHVPRATGRWTWLHCFCSSFLTVVFYDLQTLSRSVSDTTEPTPTVKPSRHYFGGSRYVEKYLLAVCVAYSQQGLEF